MKISPQNTPDPIQTLTWHATVQLFLFLFFLKPDTCVMDTDVARHCVIILILIFKKLKNKKKKNEKIWIKKF